MSVRNNEVKGKLGYMPFAGRLDLLPLAVRMDGRFGLVNLG